MKEYKYIKFKDLPVGTIFWDYEEEEQGDRFIKVSETSSMNYPGKSYEVSWDGDIVMSVENEI